MYVLAFHHWQSYMHLTHHMTVLLLTSGNPTCSLTHLMSVNHSMTSSFACNPTALLAGHASARALGSAGLPAWGLRPNSPGSSVRPAVPVSLPLL